MRGYVAGVMAMHFLVEFLLLLGTSRMSGIPVDKKRLTAASLLGAVHCAGCMLPDVRFLGNMFWRIASLVLMGGIAFGWNKRALRQCGFFLLLSMALTGIASRLGERDAMAMVLASVGLWLLCQVSFEGSPGGRIYVPLEITCGENRVKLLALRDTGNTLRDPVTGQQALVLSASAASRLTGLTARQIQNPLETLAAQPIAGLRLLPFRTIGQGSGMMLAMSFENVVIDGRKKQSLVAFAPENFGREAVFQALTGGGIS